ncbi:peptidase M23B (plasmid) [Deinococcus geothermalis DSM 11300]|uniref:Peptidase M23B n=1 Tax=Deinococcus geothermalis (strain DSM 11300 / CIP 105573 / AG-3a) TaxID=319795 RepID=A8ZRG8_DEIGD|nr:M23 family metallopeptidase [Deinococcus geothermalis]ABW35077.1 peptidase M23B [Deinococcus geothermalis DSM 11300]
MTERRVSISVEGKVLLDADVTKAKEKIKGLAGEAVIGNGAPVTGTPTTVGQGQSNPLNTMNPAYYEHLAERSYHAIAARYQQARTPAQFRDLADSLERALYNANQSGNKALTESITSLKDEVKRLEDEMHRQRQQAQGGGGGAGGGGGGSAPPPGNAGSGGGFGGRINQLGQWLAGQGQNTVLGSLTSMLGGPVGGALFGGAARFLTGPIGIGIGAISAANWAFNAVSNNITEANAPARNEIVGYADLARQYGSDKDFMRLFRDENGWTNNRFARYGYSATQAAHVAAIYDRPGGMMNDVESILQFARSTGTEESRVAALAQQIGRAGVGGIKGGNADDTLRVLKLAMTEGVKSGIAQSETLNALSSTVQRNASRGQSTNDTAFAYYANLLRRVNDPRNTDAALRGEQGLNVMKGFMDGLGDGGGDQGTEFLLIQSLIKKGLPDAKKAGMTVKGKDGKEWVTDEGIAYSALLEESPVEAARYLMQRAASGKNPQIMRTLAETIDQTSHGSVYLKKQWYKQIYPGASDEQIMSMIGGGGLSEYLGGSANSAAIERYKQGESTTSDPQGNNPLANQTMWLRVAEQDRELLKSIASLNLTAGIEGVFNDIKNWAANLHAELSQVFGGSFTQEGSLRGTAGTGWKNPSRAASSFPSPTGAGNTIGTDPSTSGPLTNGGVPGANAPITNVTWKNGPYMTPTTPAGGAAVAGNAKTIAAVAQVESSNGTDRNMNAPGKSAVGLFQMQSEWLYGPNGWAKEAGIDMKNPDGSPVTTAAQARAWQLANPDMADTIGVNRINRIEAAIRAAYGKAGLKLTDAQAAAFTEVIWHRNGGGNIAAALKLPLTHPQNPLKPLVGKGGTLITDPRYLSRSGAESDYDSYNKALAAFTDPNLKPAALRGSGQAAGQGAVRLAPDGETVRFTQGYGENKNSKEYGYDERGHLGWDFSLGVQGKGGDPVHSRTEGVVVQAGDNKIWGGKTVIVKRPDNYSVLHGHLSSVNVKVGQRVDTHTLIGKEGNTGGPPGMLPHLHIEVYNAKGEVVNPALIFGNRDMKHGQTLKGFRTGGYTGDHARDEVTGVVHGQEYVMTAEATRRYRPLLETMNAGVNPQASGQIQVNLGGSLNLNVALSAPAQAELQREYQVFQGRAARVVTTDIQNSRGVRG